MLGLICGAWVFFLGGVGVQHVESLVVACGILVLDQGPIVSEISLCHY